MYNVKAPGSTTARDDRVVGEPYTVPDGPGALELGGEGNPAAGAGNPVAGYPGWGGYPVCGGYAYMAGFAEDGIAAGGGGG